MADITFCMEVCPRFMAGPALSISKLYPKSGIFKAREIYKEFEKNEDLSTLTGLML